MASNEYFDRVKQYNFYKSAPSDCYYERLKIRI